MSKIRMFFPHCRECKEIGSFSGPEEIDPKEIKCPKCGAICEDMAGQTIQLAPGEKERILEASDESVRRARRSGRI